MFRNALPFVFVALATTSQAAGPNSGSLLSDSRIFPDKTILWDGFLTGQRSFQHFFKPIGNPLYFESPINETEARFLYLHHEFDDGSTLAGGHLDVAALQVRIALTERLGFIATKDGYSWLDAGALPDGEGWNDLALGLKYALIADANLDLVVTGGCRFQPDNGDSEVLQGGVQELSPFISVAKGFGDLHLLGNASWRLPLDAPDGNDVLQWSLHADYEIYKGIAPTVEIHGLHYLDDGDRTPLDVGGLDYTNLGSTMVSGNNVVWLGLGGQIRLTPNFSIGGTYEFALTDPDEDIMDNRITFSAWLTW